jgi:upstream activation factor subunit UAF30
VIICSGRLVARGRAKAEGDDMAKKTARKAAKGSKKKTSGGKRTANAAFMRPVTPDATVAEVVGSKPIPRTEVTKRLWAYIKKNGLQDTKNKRMINADDSLKAVFGGKASVNMFEMTKLVNKHLK